MALKAMQSSGKPENGLQMDRRFTVASGWLRDGCLDEDEFGRQIDAAMGALFYSDEAVASGRRRDVLEFNSAHDETVSLMLDTADLLS